MQRFLGASGILAAVAGALLIGPVQAATLVVDSKMYLYQAGGNTGPCCGDIAPVQFSFSAAAGQTLVFSSVTGTWDCDGPGSLCSPTGPDGNLGADVIIGSNGALSGTAYRGSFAIPLFGVFLAAGLPASPPPALDFRNVENFTILSPLLGQVFWIGDGLTGTGSGAFQTFNVPGTATRLFLGSFDLQAADNSGQMTAVFNISGGAVGVPEPDTRLLLLIGSGLLLLARRLQA
jgi:hypothetical protein